MADVPRQPAHSRAKQVSGRYFLRASLATQTKNPTVKIAKPTNAISCSKLPLASNNEVCASMVPFFSAGKGADHVHADF